MLTEKVHGLLEEFSRKPYVASTVLTSRVGVPIAGNESDGEALQLLAPLVGITYEGAYELATTAGQDFTQLSLELSDGSRIVIKCLKSTFLLAVQVKKYDDQVQGEIDRLSIRVSECI